VSAQTVTTAAKQLDPYKWQPGQSGNPAGRKKGSRHKLGEAFISALHDDFTEHGTEVIEKVRTEHPDKYLKVVASVIPQEVNHTVESYDGYSDEQLSAEFLRVAGALQERAGISIGIAAPAGPEIGPDRPLLATDGDAEPQGREEPLG
jgi:hypothetical protein